MKTARQKLAKRINDALGKTLTLKEAEKVTSEFIDAMVVVAIETGALNLNEYGKLKVIEKAARNRFNPATGETVHVQARKTLQFKPSPTFVKQLNS